MLYPKDKALTVKTDSGTLTLSWPLGAPTYLWLTAFLPIFIWMGNFVSATPLKDGSLRSPQEDFYVWVLLGSLGLFIAYTGIGYGINRCQIEATRDKIRFRCGPLPMLRAHEFMASGVLQFFAGDTLRNSSKTSPGGVYLLDAKQNAELICKALPSSFATHQVVHELLDFYGLEDLDVYGETHLPSHPGPRPRE